MWEIVLSPHVAERMIERGFTETDLRAMLDDAKDYRPSVMPGRFVVTTQHDTGRWEVIVEPDEVERVVIVVTAYRVESLT